MPLIYLAQAASGGGTDLVSGQPLGIQFSATSYRSSVSIPLKAYANTDKFIAAKAIPFNEAGMGYVPPDRLLAGSGIILPESGLGYLVSEDAKAGAMTIANLPFATALTDTKGHTVTTYGSPTIDTVTSSAVFSGASYVQLAAASDLSFGTRDFTVELYYTQTANTYPYPRLFNFSSTWNTAASWCLNSSSTTYGVNYLSFVSYTYGGNTTALLKSPAAIPLNTESHVAIQRAGNVFSMYINGVLSASATWSGSIDGAPATNSLRIGGLNFSGSNDFFQGRMRKFVISRYAKYSSNFTPA